MDIEKYFKDLNIKIDNLSDAELIKLIEDSEEKYDSNISEFTVALIIINLKSGKYGIINEGRDTVTDFTTSYTSIILLIMLAL